MDKPKLVKDLGNIKPKKTSTYKKHYALYECPVCHKEYKTMVTYVKHGRSKCCKSCSSRISATTSGMTGTRLFNIYNGMKQRCYNKNAQSYHNYGGRGINMCDEWLNSRDAFYAWAMDNGYSDELSIDRIDNNQGYFPNNCRWATRSQQAKNQRLRKTNTTGFVGIEKIKEDSFHAYVSDNYTKFFIGRFSNKQDAAIARDAFIIENDMDNKKNIHLYTDYLAEVLAEIIKADSNLQDNPIIANAMAKFAEINKLRGK